MPKTLLNAVNEILKRVKVIAGDSGELTTLTDSSRQPAIDQAVQSVNEGIDELYTSVCKPKPLSQAESTITLVTSTRSYALATNMVELVWPLIDKTNNQYIFEYPGGYNQILQDDPEQDDDGLPHYAAISPINGELYMDVIPTSAENGNVYTYQYKKDLELSVLTDTVPFDNTTFRAMVPVWAELWKRDVRDDFDNGMYRASMGRAARTLSKVPARTSYSPRR